MSSLLKKIILIPYWIWVVLLFLTFLVSSTLIASLLFFVFRSRAQRALIGLYKIWSFLFLSLSGIPVRLINYEILRKNNPAIVIANHSSNIDMFIGAYSLPLNTKPLAKMELKKIPLLGFLFATVSVLIDRSNLESRHKGSRLLKAELRKGNSIFIYPEGTRNKGSKALNPFYDGAFRFAIEGGVPLVAMCTIHARSLCPPDKLFIKPGLVKVIFLGPYHTADLTANDIPKMKQQVFDDMHEVIQKNDPLYQSSKITS
jgi:1-acyl-sn-glycerol-3-phosphate acyltransferase